MLYFGQSSLSQLGLDREVRSGKCETLHPVDLVCAPTIVNTKKQYLTFTSSISVTVVLQ